MRGDETDAPLKLGLSSGRQHLVAIPTERNRWHIKAEGSSGVLGRVAEDLGQFDAFKNIRGRMIFVGRFASLVEAGMAVSSAYPDSRLP